MARLPGYASALLNVIAGPESAGRYDVIYGGKRFSDFSDHPRVAVPIRNGPNAGKTSSAAGKYQFLGSTWDQYKNKLGLPDFSPQSQDMAAYALASDTYKAKTGRSLDATLQSGDPKQIAQVGKVLNPIWTSLPGGIEAGTNTNRFVSEFTKQISGRAPAPRMGSMDLGGSEMADAGPKQSKAIGGLGGLGGFDPPERKKGLDWAGLLSALGDGLIYGDGRAIGASFDARQAQLDKQYEREYGRARDDWMFGVQRQDRAEDRDLARQDRLDARAERREDRADALDWRKTQFEYQVGQDQAASARADRALTLQEAAANRKEAGFRDATPEEARARGVPAGQFGPDNRFYPIEPAKGQNITVNSGPNESEFAKQAAGTQVKRFGAISDGGNAAASVVQTLPQLRELLAVAPQGPVQGRLAEMFPGFSTAGDAFGAAVNQIAPTLRVAGSGAASDKDIDLLLGSFPRLRNDPAANTIILDAFQTKARINMERADIANAALRNEIKPEEADRRLQELDRQSIIPEGLRQRLGVTKAPETGLSPNQRNRPRATNPATGQVIEFDGKAWVPVS